MYLSSDMGEKSPEECFDEFERKNKLGIYAENADEDDV